MNANDGYSKPSLLDYLQWLMLYSMFTEEGLRKRAERVKGTPYAKLLLEVADARKDKGLSGVNAMRIVHDTQELIGVR